MHRLRLATPSAVRPSALALLLGLALCGVGWAPAPVAGSPAAWATLPPAPQVAPSAAHASVEPDAEETLARERILAVARAYAEHRWTAGPENTLHGPDAQGVHVDTPDAGARPDGWHADGRENVGVPYKWGGFSSLDDFDAAVAAGAPAGQLTDGVKLDASAFAVGVDCSGFVARCWGLPVKQSTRSLGRLCFELDSYAELRPGDLINKFDAHAMLFVGFADEARRQVRVVEATLPRVLENVYPVEALERAGFGAYRYKPLDARWLDVPAAPAAGAGLTDAPVFTADPARAAVVSGGADGLAALREALAAFPDRLPGARPGDWARYRIDDGRPGPLSLKTRGVARSDPDGVLVQSSLVHDGRRLQTQELQPASASLARRLLGWQDSGQAFEDLQLVGGRLVQGDARLGPRVVSATRIELELEGALTMRSRRYPVEVRLEALLSPEVPLEGVLDLSREVTYHLDGSTPRGRVGFRIAAWGRQTTGG